MKMKEFSNHKKEILLSFIWVLQKWRYQEREEWSQHVAVRLEQPEWRRVERILSVLFISLDNNYDYKNKVLQGYSKYIIGSLPTIIYFLVVNLI